MSMILAVDDRYGNEYADGNPDAIPRWIWGANPPEAVWAQALHEIRNPAVRPAHHVGLQDLGALVPKIRGVYDCSIPTVDSELCHKYGDSCTRWLTADPRWDRRRCGPRGRLVGLCEVLPIAHPAGGWWIYTWHLAVVGEGLDRYAARRLVAGQAVAALAGPWGR